MAKIYLHNTLSGTEEVFAPLTPGVVTMYNCGPTVYDSVHIGNLRTFVFGDLVRRVFEFNGYNVHQVMNITDVDDKTIARSIKEHMPLRQLTEKYEGFFREDSAALNILTPTKLVRATDSLPEIISMIATLLEKGFAYKSADGIYFSIAKSKKYGALAHLNLANESRERIASDEYDKENPRDFAVWKFHTASDGDVVWDAPFGKGRPGWHIECSAMSIAALGETIDIHTGGSDLIFPHHTNEIAQSEAATGKTFVHYWLHGAFMNVDNAKMAKSKANFLKLADLKEHTISPLAFRYWLLNAHYRTQVNVSYEALSAAQTALLRLIQHFIHFGSESTIADKGYLEKFTSFINDDIDIPKALALTWELVKDANVTAASKKATLVEFDKVFGLNLKTIGESAAAIPEEEIPAEIIALAEAREEARKAREWDKADALRHEIEARGYKVTDSDTGNPHLTHIL